jgi:hypothetical protein
MPYRAGFRIDSNHCTHLNYANEHTFLNNTNEYTRLSDCDIRSPWIAEFRWCSYPK